MWKIFTRTTMNVKSLYKIDIFHFSKSRWTLKAPDMRFPTSSFFYHESVYPWHLGIYPIGAISNFYETSRKYSQLCVYRWCQWHRRQAVHRCHDTGDKLCTVVNETGDKLCTVVNDTGDKQCTVVNETGDKLKERKKERILFIFFTRHTFEK